MIHNRRPNKNQLQQSLDIVERLKKDVNFVKNLDDLIQLENLLIKEFENSKTSDLTSLENIKTCVDIVDISLKIFEIVNHWH